MGEDELKRKKQTTKKKSGQQSKNSSGLRQNFGYSEASHKVHGEVAGDPLQPQRVHDMWVKTLRGCQKVAPS